MLKSVLLPVATGLWRRGATPIAIPGAIALFNRAITTSTIADKKKETTEKRALKATAVKQTQEQKKLLGALKQKLAKEKVTLKTLQKKLTQTEKKHAQLTKTRKQKEKSSEKAQQAKDKSVLAKAIKPVHKITAYNAYVKQTVSGKFTLAEAARAFKSLSETERASYQQKADDYNARAAELFKPKPKAPANGFARFVQQKFQAHYAAAGQDNYAAFKNISEEWKKLSDSQKNAYKPPSSAFENYSKAVEAWKADRVRAYKSQQ